METSPGTLAFLLKATMSAGFNESLKSCAVSDGPVGSRPGITAMVLVPRPCTSPRIRFCAPAPSDITSMIAVIPITIPIMVSIERDRFVRRPVIAVFTMCFIVIILQDHLTL